MKFAGNSTALAGDARTALLRWFCFPPEREMRPSSTFALPSNGPSLQFKTVEPFRPGRLCTRPGPTLKTQGLSASRDMIAGEGGRATLFRSGGPFGRIASASLGQPLRNLVAFLI